MRLCSHFELCKEHNPHLNSDPCACQPNLSLLTGNLHAHGLQIAPAQEAIPPQDAGHKKHKKEKKEKRRKERPEGGREGKRKRGSDSE